MSASNDVAPSSGISSTGGEGRVLRAFLRNPTAMGGLIVLVFFCFAAATAPYLYPEDPLSMVATPFLWPGQDIAFPLGTDSLGRDVAAQLVHGARISLLIGAIATSIGLALGVVVGGIAGYCGGRVETMMLRLIEIFQTLPSFVLLIVLVAVLKPSLVTVTLAIGLINWPTIARLTRAEFRSLREHDYVHAARALGLSHWRIILRVMMPNALPPVIVTASMMVASAILMEAALSFMGLGDPSIVSWGSMIGDAREFLRSAWYLAAWPGLAVFLAILSINLVGDGLNDAFNPRLNRTR
ncbi:Dipeptide transport system permease protein DppC [Hyphomicrobiales bacterium]|nr:Dipeptide transport system permease protein DppC [Hyphomicrobiales bacterium]CAH1693693.1 Di/tripeptide transport system permease protein DppC [Hyphomicrobiales bacterium]